VKRRASESLSATRFDKFTYTVVSFAEFCDGTYTAEESVDDNLGL